MKVEHKGGQDDKRWFEKHPQRNFRLRKATKVEKADKTMAYQHHVMVCKLSDDIRFRVATWCNFHDTESTPDEICLVFLGELLEDYDSGIPDHPDTEALRKIHNAMSQKFDPADIVHARRVIDGMREKSKTRATKH